MKQKDQDIFFAVLRTALWKHSYPSYDQDIALIPDGYDWMPLLQAYSEHALLGLVANTIKFLPKGKRPEEEKIQNALTTSFMNHIMLRNKLQTTIVEIFSKLKEEGIVPVLMKGESLVHFYPENCQRAIGDIDLLVPSGKYHQTVDILQRMTGDMGCEDWMERHHKVHKGTIAIEIHPQIVWCANWAHKKSWMSLSQKYLKEDTYDTVNLRDQSIHVFPLHYNILYVFNHFMEHLRDGGIGFKQIIDWMMLLEYAHHHTEAFNTDVLKQELDSCGLLRAWKVMGGIAVLNLGLSKESFPFYEENLAHKSQGDILKSIIDGGDFGMNFRTQEENTRIAPLRILHNARSILKQTRFLWTLYPSGAIASCLAIVRSSLRNHFSKILHATI